MRNKTVLILVIILILLVGGVALYFTSSTTTVENNINQPTPIDTSSIEGCYVTKLAKDVYTMNILSEDNGVVDASLAYNNFEKDSSSGPLIGTFDGSILIGNYSFDSEGMHSNRQVIFKKVGNNFVQGFGPAKTVEDKEVFTDTNSITYDSKSTFVKSGASCMETFTDANNTFTFEHSALFPTVDGNTSAPTLEWEQNAKEPGILLASVTIPRSYMSGTNFSSARMTVGRSTDLKSCLIDNSGSNVKGTPATLGGFPVTKFVSSDAGAGNFYESTSYKGTVDGDCYVVEYTIRSTNIGNYSPDQGVQEFDKAKIQNELEKIIKSFRFLVNSD